MRTWKIVSGIFSILISLFVLLQSFANGTWSTLIRTGEASGTAGVIVSLALFTGGAASLAVRNGSRSGDIALSVLFGISAVAGITMAGDAGDLIVWAIWSLLCMFLALIDLGIGGYSDADSGDDGGYDNEFDLDADYPEPRPEPAGRIDWDNSVSMQDVILEKNPKKRDAVIDALPEKEAKSFLKQAMNLLVPRHAAGRTAEEDDDALILKILIAFLALVGVFIVGVMIFGILSVLPEH